MVPPSLRLFRFSLTTTIHVYFHYYDIKHRSIVLWTICNKLTERPFLKTPAIMKSYSRAHPFFKRTFVAPHLAALQQSRVTHTSNDMKYVRVLEGSQVISSMK